MRSRRKRSRDGFTIPELLVSIGIVGILLALILPAVQAGREAARRCQCQSNVRQLGLAVVNHESHQRAFPGNGWGALWSGMPGGQGMNSQPGGWIYQILPYLEGTTIGGLGSADAVVQSHIGTLYCPSRRQPGLYPYEPISAMCNVSVGPKYAGKSDYAVSGGDTPLPGGGWAGPPCSIPWKFSPQWPDVSSQNGVAHVGSRVRFSDLCDGSSNILMLGEKSVRVADHHPVQKPDTGDNQSAFNGDSADIRRWASMPPRRDRAGISNALLFGSRHGEMCYFTMCDGAVRGISFEIDWRVFRRMGNRNDGEVVVLD